MSKQPNTSSSPLTRRERQVMDILHRRGESTVAEIMADLPDPPTYSAVRSILRILGEKELVEFKEDGPRYVYFPATSTGQAQTDMLEHVVRTYFAGSTEQAVTALLRLSDADIPEKELSSLRERIRSARQSGR
ncbi:BlaI/MecI/CopY family transcriptional regulator [Gemmatimonas sp.]|uniref:BlaI/MecI/CopY family transcriptional regulator n=1 Tax=Gemmatimonas sp. TaxID=1962908 RepID=UPI00286CE8B3|nr:BlaI/MecI/CopY family transcriptional regulator [Gemmatimonas sp.]